MRLVEDIAAVLRRWVLQLSEPAEHRPVAQSERSIVSGKRDPIVGAVVPLTQRQRRT